jgi:hypothetical protein
MVIVKARENRNARRPGQSKRDNSLRHDLVDCGRARILFLPFAG